MSIKRILTTVTAVAVAAVMSISLTAAIANASPLASAKQSVSVSPPATLDNALSSVISTVPALGNSVSAFNPALFATASTSKSCTTTGYSYQVDSMYVVRSWDSTTNSYKYVVTRTPNHNAYDPNNHLFAHSAIYLHVYWSSSSMSTYSNPANSVTVHSASSGVDFRMVFKVVVDGGVQSFTKSCDVNF